MSLHNQVYEASGIRGLVHSAISHSSSTMNALLQTPSAVAAVVTQSQSDAITQGISATPNAVPVPGELYCTNTLDDSFFNKCRREVPAGFFVSLGESIASFVNPIGISVYGAVLLFAVALIVLKGPNGRSSANLAHYRRIKLQIINWIHRTTYTLTLNVALYAVFRQHRPCTCTMDGGATYTQVGSIYGMPSGDAMSGGITGMYFILWKPFGYTYGNYFMGALMVLLKCIERLSLGMHSLGQVTAGAGLGIVLTLYSEYAPQYFVLVDSIVMVLIGAIALPLDSSALQYPRDDSLNITSWYIWGTGLNLFVMMLLVRFFMAHNWQAIKLPLRGALATITDNSTNDEYGHHESDSLSAGHSGSEALLYSGDEAEATASSAKSDSFLHRQSDIKFDLIGFCAFLAIVLFSNMYYVYDWGFS
jgi:membrane-associated phospholipid phosphatase